MSHEAEQVLTSVFLLGQARYGIPAAQIQEVVPVGTLTSVHHAPAHVAGIRNLRGHIVTVIDLRRKLGQGPAQISAESRILIVDLGTELIGLLVEAVEDTVFLDAAEASSAAPEIGIEPAMLRGVYRSGPWLLAMLNYDVVLGTEVAGRPSGAGV